jgi:hypothetical protein
MNGKDCPVVSDEQLAAMLEGLSKAPASEAQGWLLMALEELARRRADDDCDAKTLGEVIRRVADTMASKDGAP